MCYVIVIYYCYIIYYYLVNCCSEETLTVRSERTANKFPKQSSVYYTIIPYSLLANEIKCIGGSVRVK